MNKALPAPVGHQGRHHQVTQRQHPGGYGIAHGPTESRQCGEKQHPFTEELLADIRLTLGTRASNPPAQGQLLYLDLIQDLAPPSDDPDWTVPMELANPPHHYSHLAYGL